MVDIYLVWHKGRNIGHPVKIEIISNSLEASLRGAQFTNVVSSDLTWSNV